MRKRPRSSTPRASNNGGGVFGDESDSDSDDVTRRVPLSLHRTSETTYGAQSAKKDFGKMRDDSDVTVKSDTSTPTHENMTDRAEMIHESEKRPTAKRVRSGGDADPLDIFMNSLEAPPPLPQISRSPLRSAMSPDSEEEERTVDGEKVILKALTHESAEDVARALHEERRSLTLVAVDHATMKYEAIEKRLYEPLPRLAALSDEEVATRVSGARLTISASIVPVSAFADLALALPRALLGALMHAFDGPTPVQRAVLPAALSGYDVLATADTGSGKTVAYLVPLIAHAVAQHGDVPRGGARAIVLAPTRELASQIAREARRFGVPARISVTLLTGGGSKLAQARALRDGHSNRLVVATPGRLIDMVKMRAMTLESVSILAVDEADRMLDLGFGPQVRTILAQIRPDAQRLLLSATLPSRVRSLATEMLNDAVEICASAPKDGCSRSVSLVAEGVRETYVVLREGRQRWEWLDGKLKQLTANGLVIVFCRSRGACAALSNRIRCANVPVACVHGETDHGDRVSLLRMFRRGEVRVLVSTDLAARGLDIGGVANVVNYETAKDWDWHVHRVGRTGRAGETGDAFTLLCEDSGADSAWAHRAVDALRKGRVNVPAELGDFVKTSRKRKGR